jgi:hypothetical protein
MVNTLKKRWRIVAGWGLVLVGLGVLGAGWYGVSGNPDVARQLSYIVSGGIGGLLAGIVGVGLLVSNDIREDRERLGRLESSVLELRDLLLAQQASISNGAPKRRAAATKGE